MKDQLISFDAAKLAKEKGFKEYCIAYFSISGEEMYFREDGMYFHSNGANGRLILRPTQSLLQKWLREQFFYHIYLIPLDNNKWGFEVKYISLMLDDFISYLYSGYEYNSYEEALESGLMKALEMIK